MNELLLQVLLEGGTLAVFVAFVIYQARTGREERRELTEMMLTMYKNRGAEANLAMENGLDTFSEINGNIIELTKANAELSKVIAVHDRSSSDRFDEVIRKLDKIAAGP